MKGLTRFVRSTFAHTSSGALFVSAVLISALLAGCLPMEDAESGIESDTDNDSGTSSDVRPATPPALALTSNMSWQWQLSGSLNTGYDVQVYDIDLFDTPTTTITELKNQDRIVVCYFSAGSWEEWRDDADDFPAASLGNTLDGWEDERWLDIRLTAVRNIMAARLDVAVEKGCQAVEPDNMDGYTNNNGLGLTAADQLSFNKFIANAARERGLAVGLKNDLDQIVELEPFYDFAVNEQCHEYDECDLLLSFANNNKAIFNAEYSDSVVNDSTERSRVCASSATLKISTLFLPLDLDDSFRFDCE